MAPNKASMAAELRGQGPGGGGLRKLRIAHNGQDYVRNGPIYALFNPHEISRTRRVTWEPKCSPNQGSGWTWADMAQQFRAMEPETLSVELFFDTYESRPRSSDWKQSASLVQPSNLSRTGNATDVTKLTGRVAKLAEVDKELHQPPLCRLSWGSFKNIFIGVLTQLDQRFTMFLADGTPVRATLTCSFEECLTEADARAREMNSADVVKTRVVHRHDTLHSIAAEEYRDPTLWRYIATANGIINPRHLEPGKDLIIPKITDKGMAV